MSEFPRTEASEWRKEIAAAHARGKIEGRKMQAEEDARIVDHSLCDVAEDEAAFLAHRNYFAARIRSAAAKIGDDNDRN